MTSSLELSIYSLKLPFNDFICVSINSHTLQFAKSRLSSNSWLSPSNFSSQSSFHCLKHLPSQFMISSFSISSHSSNNIPLSNKVYVPHSYILFHTIYKHHH